MTKAEQEGCVVSGELEPAESGGKIDYSFRFQSSAVEASFVHQDRRKWQHTAPMDEWRLAIRYPLGMADVRGSAVRKDVSDNPYPYGDQHVCGYIVNLGRHQSCVGLAIGFDPHGRQQFSGPVNAHAVREAVAHRATLEVFRDVAIRMESAACVRRALVSYAATEQSEWKHVEENSHPDDILVLARHSSGELEASRLVLTPTGDGLGYEVRNIVPREVDELSYRQYNALLCNFVDNVVRDVNGGEDLRVTGPTQDRQSIHDWLARPAADALVRFSSRANRAAAIPKPSDRSLWCRFLHLLHRDPSAADFRVDRLRRWLIEIGGWSDEAVDDLCAQFEFGMGLLAHDQTAG